MLSFLFGKYLEMEWLDDKEGIFKENAKFLSKDFVPFYISTTCILEFQFLHISTNTWYVLAILIGR